MQLALDSHNLHKHRKCCMLYGNTIVEAQSCTTLWISEIYLEGGEHRDLPPMRLISLP